MSSNYLHRITINDSKAATTPNNYAIDIYLNLLKLLSKISLSDEGLTEFQYSTNPGL